MSNIFYTDEMIENAKNDFFNGDYDFQLLSDRFNFVNEFFPKDNEAYDVQIDDEGKVSYEGYVIFTITNDEYDHHCKIENEDVVVRFDVNSKLTMLDIAVDFIEYINKTTSLWNEVDDIIYENFNIAEDYLDRADNYVENLYYSRGDGCKFTVSLKNEDDDEEEATFNLQTKEDINEIIDFIKEYGVVMQRTTIREIDDMATFFKETI